VVLAETTIDSGQRIARVLVKMLRQRSHRYHEEQVAR
jgi:hypothetical protein